MAEAELIETDRIPGAPHPRETARLIGQGRAEAAFLSAWREGRLHHAWLLRGPEGIGKATLAYRIARAIIAEGPGASSGLFGDAPVPETLDIPASCPVAARIHAGAEPGLKVLRLGVNDRTGKPRTQILVEDVRGVKSFLQLSAAEGGWRVVIVDPADAMNRSAANALLKMLEEPPARVLILLVSHAPGGLLPTIRSRCRTLDLAPLSAGDLQTALAHAEVVVPAGQGEALGALSAGSVGRAVRLIAGEGLSLYARLVALMGDGRIDRASMIALADFVTGKAGAETYPLVVDLTQTLLARLARAAAMGEAPAMMAPGEPELIARLAQTPWQAQLWAEAAARAGERFRHAGAVNLDPGQTIIDTCLDLDTMLGQARRSA